MTRSESHFPAVPVLYCGAPRPNLSQEKVPIVGNRMRLRPRLNVPCSLLTLALICFAPVLSIAAPGQKNIFDDDWTPAAPKAPQTQSADSPIAPAGQSDSPPDTPPAPSEPARNDPLLPPQITPPARSAKANAARAIPAKSEQANSRKLFKEIFATE